MKTIPFNGKQLQLDDDQFNALTRFLRALGYLEQEPSKAFDHSELFEEIFKPFTK